MNPLTEMPYWKTARGRHSRAGLAFDYCDVAVVTNIGDGDHLGLSDINTPKTGQSKAVHCRIRGASGVAVLNATIPWWWKWPSLPGGVVFFAIDGNHPVIVRHRGRAAGAAVFVRDGQIVLAEGDREEVLMSLERLPLTRGGQVAFQVENTLAAVAAAWSLKVPADLILAQADRLPPIWKKCRPIQCVEMDGATVVVDYGHNTHSFRRCSTRWQSSRMSVRTVVYSTPATAAIAI